LKEKTGRKKKEEKKSERKKYRVALTELHTRT
jgi:hypothetical protein